jgi:hypothetical protein
MKAQHERKRRRHRALLGSVGLIATVIAGCSGDDGRSLAREAPDIGDATSPLIEYIPTVPSSRGFGAVTFTYDSTGWEQTAEQRHDAYTVEELTATCMAEKGFDYVIEPRDDDQESRFAEAHSLDPESFAHQYGYGASTIMYLESATTLDDTDPNETIREGLSESAQEAYDQALWGAEEHGSHDGCYGQAWTEVYGASGPSLDDIAIEFSALEDDLSALEDRIDRDPLVAAAMNEWRQCMAGRGYPEFDNPSEARDSVWSRAGYDMTPHDPVDTPIDDETGVVIEGDAVFVIEPDQLQRLQQYELDVATADLECRADHEKTFREVALQLEREFVDDNRAELERYRDVRANS